MTPAQTPERPVTTWSDEELVRVVKTRGLIDTMRRFLAELGAVHPAEVRERERWAYDRGSMREQSRPQGRDRYSWIGLGINEEYPSLTPPSPPPLVLSTGEWTRDKPGCWHCENGIQLGAETYGVGAYARTASDAEALAKWLRAYGDEQERG